MSIIPFKLDLDSIYEAEHFSGNIFNLLPEDHDCFVFKDLLDRLDTSSIEEKYSPMGQHGFHPKKLVAILIYGYTHGVFSSRQLERRCNEDLSFMYIANMHCPNFRVLSDFRKNNPEFFHACFRQTVALAIEMQLVSLGHVSLDGSKFKANSSKHKAMSYRHLKAKEHNLCEEIEALINQANASDGEEDREYQEKTGYEYPEDIKFKEQRLEKIQAAKKALEAREEALNPGKAIEDKKQISFADTDARIMGKQGDFDYRFNGQISVDSAHQIIVGQHVSQNANDKQEVGEGLKQIENTTGKLPEKMSLDNGYASGANLESLEESEVDAYVAMGRHENASQNIKPEAGNRRLLKEDFIYNREQDCFQCPEGQLLELKSQGSDGRRTYQGNADTCRNCQYHVRCCQSKKGEARSVTADIHEETRQNMREKMEKKESREIYKKRKVIVEPVFGQIKNDGGFSGFSLRGKEKVAGEFSLVCAGHNLKKMAKAMMTGWVRPVVVQAI